MDNRTNEAALNNALSILIETMANYQVDNETEFDNKAWEAIETLKNEIDNLFPF